MDRQWRGAERGGTVAEIRDVPFGPGPLKGLRVLLAEDDGWVAHQISVMLEEEGARLIGPCSRVEEARRLLAAHDVQFILVDLNLADKFADELTEDARIQGIPFAIITAYQALPTNAYEGAVGVFLKPIQRRRLIDMLSEFT